MKAGIIIRYKEKKLFIKSIRLLKYSFVSFLAIIIAFFLGNTVYSAQIQLYNGEFDYIAYSGVVGINDAPINTAEHYELCASDAFAFDTIKGDLRVTSDNKIVMCHDEGFSFNSEGRIVDYNSSNMTKIHDLTYAQCMALQYAKKYRGNYTNVCDFETYLSICARNNKKAFITIRNEYIPELLSVIMPMIYRYGMQSKCIINSFTLNSLKLVRQYDSSIKLSWVINNGKLSNDVIDTAIDLGNCLLTLYNFDATKHGGFPALSSYEPYILYAQQKGVSLYTALVGDVSIIDQLRSFGISGAQINAKCNHIKHYWDEGSIKTNPTYSSFGEKLFKCIICGETKTEIIPVLKRSSLKSCIIKGIKDKTYNGKVQTQNVTITYGSTILKKDKDYTVSYSKNKNTGVANVKYKGKGKYKDTVIRYFYIKPKKTKFKSIRISKRKAVIKWNRAKSGTGYETQYRESKSDSYKSIRIEGLKKNKVIIKKLKRNKIYLFRIRVYKKTGEKIIYSKWSKLKKKRSGDNEI